MEEYLESMKSLRSYMNDLEDDAAKRSVEEQQQRTAIDAHDSDVALVMAQAKQASEEAERLATARAKVGMQMAEKQGRIATLDIECATLKQVAKSQSKQNFIEGEKHVIFNSEGSLDKFNKPGKLYTQLVSAQLKIQDIKSQRSALLLEISRIKQILEQEKNIIPGFPAALQQMDMKSLEEEYKALQGDKSGEVEYFQSLDETINGMKGILDPVKCQCGLEYNLKLDGEAMDIS
ncbi:uncharacterized protein [Zea mays]|uniref:uncharacterized protein isoform X5 n=1 Tax=Zea mays TaxID=4577 RepID=UPI000C6C60B8|nr:uncharacterized protein LOC103639340 isoform X5 [Zea mays]|eukprot:XP_023157065.1 uncharacterized protein LOC103639340 isoform X5 [Zea mays]